MRATSPLSPRVLVGAAIMILCATLGATRAVAFDCVGVSLPSSIVICSDPELIRLADERQAAFNEARGRVGDAGWPELWENQKAWVRSYSTTCGVPPDPPPPTPVPAPMRECFKRAAIARTAYLRTYGTTASTTPVQSVTAPPSPDRLGPGFDCSKAKHTLALMICGDPDLSRVDLMFNQAFWALYQQLDEGQQREQLKEEDIEFLDDVQGECWVPTDGPPSDTLRAHNCVKENYAAQRGIWLSRLRGIALEEASRPLERHVLLQRKLRQLGLLGGPVIPEGVYTHDTRQAIVAWQLARNRPPTGFLSDADAALLEQEGETITAALPPKPAEPSPMQPVAPSPGPKKEQGGTGTAFAIDRAGDFLTNYHVVKGCSSLRLRVSGEWDQATLTASDERNDLAVIRVRPAPTLTPLRFRSGKGIRPADQVVALGFPYAGLLTTNLQVTTGAVSALSGIRDDSRYLQLTAPIQPGNSGGPLLDLSSNVVAVVSGRLNELLIAEATGTLPQNVNFAIKSGIVQAFLDASRIDYETAPSTEKRDPADVGEAAAKSVFMVECY